MPQTAQRWNASFFPEIVRACSLIFSSAGLDLPQDVLAEEQEEVADGCEHEQAC